MICPERFSIARANRGEMASWHPMPPRARIEPMARLLIQRPSAVRCVALLLTLSCWQVAARGAEDLKSARASQSNSAEIFNGRDLTGWVPVGKGASADWTVEDGCLICHEKGHTWLRSARQFGDFHLSLEYQ